MSDPENRPQYCICNKHTWLTAISKRATFECPACRADELQAQLDAVRDVVLQQAEMEKRKPMRQRTASNSGERVMGLPVIDNFPEKLRLRDTELHDDQGGLGQRIFTTAGAGYVKQEYVRADLYDNSQAQLDVQKEVIEALDFSWEKAKQRWHTAETKLAAVRDDELQCVLSWVENWDVPFMDDEWNVI